MPYYRVTFEGIFECEFESAEAAKQDFIDFVAEEATDAYGRTWTDLIAVEEFDEKTKTWK